MLNLHLLLFASDSIIIHLNTAEKLYGRSTPFLLSEAILPHFTFSIIFALIIQLEFQLQICKTEYIFTFRMQTI